MLPRDEAAAPDLLAYSSFQAPTPGFAEQVYYHEMAADNDGNVRVALINPELDGGLGIYLQYHQKHLPRFIQWKMMGYGSYVLGLEPANCYVEGRSKERERGTLLVLQPGEKVCYQLEIGVLDGREEIERCTQAIRLGAGL